MKDLELTNAMWQAVHSDLGVAVEVTDVDAMRRKFYQIRKANPEMQCLSTILPPTDNPNEVWIIKRPETPDASQED